MALRGNLRDFSITQLLNLISVAQKTGTLIVERGAERVWVSFREGRVAYARAGKDENLAAILYRSNKLSAAQFRAIQERAVNISDKELGLLLINANYITQQDIIASLQSYFTLIVNRLFNWMEGLFRFENDLLPPDDKITVRINLENIIIEGTRRLREQEQISDEIPTLDIALKFTERPGASLKNLNLSVDEWRVVSFINPKNSIRQIAVATKKTEVEMRRIVYGLLQAGIVELVRTEGDLASPGPVRQPVVPVNKEEQKSLINRLISRIRSI
jgi:hypothetical protein